MHNGSRRSLAQEVPYQQVFIYILTFWVSFYQKPYRFAHSREILILLLLIVSKVEDDRSIGKM